jgi:predicted PurR-regulated permease PerM
VSDSGQQELRTSLLSERTIELGTRTASYLLMAGFLACALRSGLMTGLLAACLGCLFANGLKRLVFRGQSLPAPWCVTLVILAPLLALTYLAFQAKGLTTSAFAQFPALLQQMSQTVLDLRQKLPPSIAGHVPDEIVAVQEMLSEYLKARASFMASVSQEFLSAALLAYVGLVVGALLSVSSPRPGNLPLTAQLRERAVNFLAAFSQIVAAQFCIAAFNAACTAVFLYGILPAFKVNVPYAASLVALTFFAGMVPIVGNLLCNGVLTLVGTSVSPMVGLSCLGFLIAIHKFEYVINAKVVGRRTATGVWELLAVMFVAEALVGIVGLIAAPLYYAYIKRELRAAELV